MGKLDCSNMVTSPTGIGMMEVMLQANIPFPKVFAFKMTGRILTNQNRKRLQKSDINEWNEFHDLGEKIENCMDKVLCGSDVVSCRMKSELLTELDPVMMRKSLEIAIRW